MEGKKVASKCVKTIQSRLLFCCMLGRFLLGGGVTASVISFSTLYFLYVSHPRDFIGRSARVIHGQKWRGGWEEGGGARLPAGTSWFTNHAARRQTPTRRRSTSSVRAKASTAPSPRSEERTSIRRDNYLKSRSEFEALAGRAQRTQTLHAVDFFFLLKKIVFTCGQTVTVAISERNNKHGEVEPGVARICRVVFGSFSTS